MKYLSKSIHFHSRKCKWKCRLQNGVYWISVSMSECIAHITIYVTQTCINAQTCHRTSPSTGYKPVQINKCSKLIAYANYVTAFLHGPLQTTHIWWIHWQPKFNSPPPWTKRPAFRERHFRMYFLEWRYMNSDWYFTEVCCYGSNKQYPSIVSDNGLALTRLQAIIWTKDVLLTHIYVTWPQRVKSLSIRHRPE